MEKIVETAFELLQGKWEIEGSNSKIKFSIWRSDIVDIVGYKDGYGHPITKGIFTLEYDPANEKVILKNGPLLGDASVIEEINNDFFILSSWPISVSVSSERPKMSEKVINRYIKCE